MTNVALQPDNDDFTEATFCMSGCLITVTVVHVYMKVPALLLTRTRRPKHLVTWNNTNCVVILAYRNFSRIVIRYILIVAIFSPLLKKAKVTLRF